MTRTVAGVCLLLFIAPAALWAAPGLLSGAFFQLDGELASFSASAWSQELTWMRDVGMDTVIIQYAAYGEVFYYPSEHRAPENGPVADESFGTLRFGGSRMRARYVKLVIEPTSVEWTMLAEVEISSDGTVLSRSASYTVTPPVSPSYPDGGKLTDGQILFSWQAVTGWQNPRAPISVVIDLGDSRLFNEVAVTFMRSEVSNVQIPREGYKLYISNDGEHFLYAGRAAWKSGGGGPAPVDTLERVLEAADRLGMKVFLGLRLDPEFWAGRFVLDKEVAATLDILEELYSRYSAHSSLAGWYLPHEISDRMVMNPTRSSQLIAFMAAVVNKAHEETKLPVMVSPYFGMHPDAKKYAAWWDKALAAAPVDIVAMQDGVGTRRTTVAEGVPVFRALAPVLARHGTGLWANNESFRQTHGWPVDGENWQAEPTTPELFVQQITATAPFVSAHVTFDFPHYMSPRLGGRALALYKAYAAYRTHRGGSK